MDLFKRDLSAGDCFRAAQLWSWAGVRADMTVFAVSHFGDLFLEAPDGVWTVDVVAGRVLRGWNDREALYEDLRDPEAQDAYLHARLLRRVLQSGRTLRDGCVLAFAVPPRLTGAGLLDHVESVPIVDAHRRSAELHRQIREAPEGVAIMGVEMFADGSARLALEATDQSLDDTLIVRDLSGSDLARVLRLWEWVGVRPDMRVIATSRFGDLFVEHDGWIWHLDIFTAEFVWRWHSESAMESALATKSGQERFLRSRAVRSALDDGLAPGPGQVLAPALSPALGGDVDGPLIVTPLVAAHHVTSQLHTQVRALPPGTAIHGVDVDGEGNMILITEPPS